MKPNVVTFTCADGRVETFPLDVLIERGALIANKINGEDISAVLGSANQLWIPGLPAKYHLRDIVGVEFAHVDEPPVLPAFADDGHDYTNRPNVAAKCSGLGRVGEPMDFTGWADDYDRAIAAIEFSLDGGAAWTRFETPGATVGKLTTWQFSWTPVRPGTYTMLVRAVNEDGKASPVPALCDIEVLD